MKLPEAWRSRFAQLSDERFYLYLLIAAALFVAVLTTGVALELNRNFLTIACDTAAFQNAIVNTLDGRWFRDTAYDGPNLLGLHSTFILAPLALIYAISPSTDTLFTLQIFGVWSAVIPLYLIAVARLGKPVVAFFLAATGLVSPLFLEMAWAPFHPETWILAAVLWSYFFYLRNRPAGFWISLGFAFCCGEQAGLIYATLGASWFFFDDGIAWRKRYGLRAMIAGLGWIALTTGFLGPLMHHPGQRNLVGYNYANWSVQSFPQLAEQVCAHPLKAAMLLLNPGRWGHFLGLIGVPLALALFSRNTLPLLAPFGVYFLMNDQEFFLYFHAYYFQFAFLAGFLALLGFLLRHSLPTRKAVTMLGATLLLSILSLCGTVGLYLGTGMGADNVFSETLHETFAQIPVEAGVYTPHRYSAYLSNRENMVLGDMRDPHLDFDAMLQSKFSTTDVRPDQIDYLVCDLVNDQCGWRQSNYNEQLTKQRTDNISKLVQSGQWQIFWSQNNVFILRRTPKSGNAR